MDAHKKCNLEDYPTAAARDVKENKEHYLEKTRKNLEKIAVLQEMLYADGRESLVIVLQAMDAAGKDSTVKHVMSSVNPQGVDVYSFKAPNSTELSHDYLYRIVKCLPQRGKMAIFNRSHYEDVLVVKVRGLEKTYRMPERCKGPNLFEKRYRQIRDFEEYLYENAFRMVKIFLHVSKDEQRKRFIERMDKPDKHWKFSSADIDERALWDDYQKAYEDAISQTATEHCPWYVVPADSKWYTRYVVSEIVLHTLEEIDPQYPELAKAEQEKIPEYKNRLENE